MRIDGINSVAKGTNLRTVESRSVSPEPVHVFNPSSGVSTQIIQSLLSIVLQLLQQLLSTQNNPSVRRPG